MTMSMTGFASKTFTLSLDSETQATVTINIKSLNSRFFETTFKLPYALTYLETDLMQLMKAKLKRGHIFFTINMSSSSLFKGNVEPAMSVIQGYLNAITKVQEKFKIGGSLAINDLVQLPNVFVVEEKSPDEKLKSYLIKAAEETLEILFEARKKEGAFIQKDMEQRCVLLQKEITEIERVSESLMTQRKEVISQGIHDLGTALEESVEAQRVMLYNELNKIDIHEEIVRFKSHLNSLKALLMSPEGEKGKRVDFTLQELAREINTIAAKCSDATISTLAINSKVEIEKIREQAQNIV